MYIPPYKSSIQNPPRERGGGGGGADGGGGSGKDGCDGDGGGGGSGSSGGDGDGGEKKSDIQRGGGEDGSALPPKLRSPSATERILGRTRSACEEGDAVTRPVMLKVATYNKPGQQVKG